MSPRSASGVVRGRPGPQRGIRSWSSSTGSAGESRALPVVRITTSGSPRPSTSAWVFVVRPPRNRCRDRPVRPPATQRFPAIRPPPRVSGDRHFRPRSSRPMLVNTDDRGVNRHIPVDLTLGIRLGRQGNEDRIPGPVLGEASGTLPDRLPRPELRRQITSSAPCPKSADRPLNQRAMRPHRPAHRPFQQGQRRLDSSPHLVRKNRGT